MDNPEPGQQRTGKYLREHTKRRREDIGSPEKVAALVQQVLGHISDVGLDLAIFLNAVFWGNDHLVADNKAKYERSTLTHSDELPNILERWGKQSTAARVVLRTHALSTIKAAINAEMDGAVSELTMAGDEVDEERLLGITQDSLVKRLKPLASTLWEILETSATRKDRSRNKHSHNPEKVRSGLSCGVVIFDRLTDDLLRDLPTGIPQKSEGKHVPEIPRSVPKGLWTSGESI